MALEKEVEKKIIERGLLLYFSCYLCKELQWDKKCHDKAECGQRLYKLLQWHFEKKD